MSIARTIIGCCLSLGCVVAAHADTAAYVKLDSFSYSDAFTVKGLFDDLSGPLERGDTAFSFNQAEVGFSAGAWQLGYFVRSDYFAEFHPDTARLFYQGQNDLPADLDHYRVDLHLRHLRADGLALRYTLTPADSLRFKAGLNLLHASDLTDGRLRGDVSALGGSLFDAQATLQYHYGEDHLLDRKVAKPSDWGYSFDLDADWALTPQLSLYGQLRDLGGRIEWSRAPYTYAQVNTNTVTTDADGFLNVTPAITGVETFTKHVQRLPLRYELGAHYTTDDGLWRISPALLGVEDTLFPRISVQRNYGAYQVGAMYDATAQAVGVHLSTEYCSAALASDSFKLSSAHMLELRLGCMVRF